MSMTAIFLHQMSWNEIELHRFLSGEVTGSHCLHCARTCHAYVNGQSTNSNSEPGKTGCCSAFVPRIILLSLCIVISVSLWLFCTFWASLQSFYISLQLWCTPGESSCFFLWQFNPFMYHLCVSLQSWPVFLSHFLHVTPWAVGPQ